MPATKSGGVPTKLQNLFDNIKDVLIKTKPKLQSSTTRDAQTVNDLHHVASLAQAFSELRPKGNTDCTSLADALDQEGVSLWNMSGMFRQGWSSESETVVAALRFAGFRLMEAGLETAPGTEGLAHILQIASKTGATLSETGNHAVASAVLSSAAKYEETLRSLGGDSQGSHQQTKARAITVYYSSRMEAAWRERNDGLATFMSEKIVDNANYLAFLPPRDRELLASKLLDIGKAILRAANQGAKSGLEGPVNAIRWLQRAFSVIEPLDATTHGLAELKRSILRSLARGYFLSSSEDPENLSRAEVVIQELIDNVDGSVDQGSSEYQQLRWMRLAVVKRRKAGDSAILEALNSIIDYTSFSEANLADFLQELRTLSQQHAVVTAATQRCLNRVLEQPENDASVDKLLLSLIFHTSKDDDHARAMVTLDSSLADISGSEFELSKGAATACLTLLWQYGNRHYQSAGWDAAAGWYMCGAHAAFKCLGPVSDAKCFRKAALCYVHKKEYARAASVIRKCSSSQATTQYVVFLIAVHQGFVQLCYRYIINDKLGSR